MDIDLNQWVTQTEVAAAKGMTLSNLAYHLAKPNAPKHEVRYGRKVYRLTEINNWHPATNRKAH